MRKDTRKIRYRGSRSRIQSYESGSDKVLEFFLDYTLKVGHKKFWKLDINVLKEDYGSFRGGMLENRELESRWSNIAKWI